MSAPGWYDDPYEAGMLRYFDGNVWTEATQPDPQALYGSQGYATQYAPRPTSDVTTARYEITFVSLMLWILAVFLPTIRIESLVYYREYSLADNGLTIAMIGVGLALLGTLLGFAQRLDLLPAVSPLMTDGILALGVAIIAVKTAGGVLGAFDLSSRSVDSSYSSSYGVGLFVAPAAATGLAVGLLVSRIRSAFS